MVAGSAVLGQHRAAQTLGGDRDEHDQPDPHRVLEGLGQIARDRTPAIEPTGIILAGQASTVAAAIRRKATTLKLTPTQRERADTCASYLLNKHRYLNYPLALQAGWPIATGVIEGACRHLIQDRMDLTGARWGLTGAEATLKLRTIITNNDFDAYWNFHLTQEQHRVHHHRYWADHAPTA